MQTPVPWRQLLAEKLESPEFRAAWEANALAREVANFVIAYRVEHGLSQTALARQLGMTQSQVARLEDGEHEPRLSTLRRLSEVLGMSVAVTVRPPGEPGAVGESTVAVVVT